MGCNVGGVDRAARILIGLALLLLSIVSLSGALSVAGYALGAVLLLTGLVRFCPLSALFGFNTCADTSAGSE